MRKSIKQNNKGFTLIETLVAVSIFSVSLIGILSVLGSGIADTNYAKRKMTATYLAQEGIEYIRNVRDTYVLYATSLTKGWGEEDEEGTFINKIKKCNLNGNNEGCGINNSVPMTQGNFIFKCTSNEKCNLSENNGNYYSNGNNSSTDPDSGFIRRIWMEETVPGAEAKIFSKVEWKQGPIDHDITFSESLFNWTE